MDRTVEYQKYVSNFVKILEEDDLLDSEPQNMQLPTKVPCHLLNFGTVAAIFMNVVSRYSKLDIRYRMRPLPVSPGRKLQK